ncbi:MAG TPA: NADH-quinone oxidoreductase subunit C [Bryobacteraceae bacterium]|nr:NADH-quinone oxidoreductase subunit C [Bryobacteraceae bacterium]
MLPENLRENAVAASLEAADPGLIVDANTLHNELTLEVVPEKILAALRILKGQKFERLSTVTAVDRYPMEPRFEVVYHLQSVSRNLFVRLKCRVNGEKPEIDSATAVYASANWYERETWDLFGIVFLNHPNLTRIMMPDFWEGHPLRRDYPVHGHKYSYQNE